MTHLLVSLAHDRCLQPLHAETVEYIIQLLPQEKTLELIINNL